MKKKIEAEKGEEFSASSQKLIHSGKIMEDEKTLKDYKVSEKGFIVVMVTSKSKAVAADSPPATNTPETPMETGTKPESTSTATAVAKEEPKEVKKSEVCCHQYNNENKYKILF